MRISITLAIVAITVLVSWRAFGDRRLLERLILWPPAVERGRQYDRLLTYGFVHADWMHLLFNMLALWSFGTAVEQVFTQWLGPLGYVLFYLSAIVVAILPTYLSHGRMRTTAAWAPPAASPRCCSRSSCSIRGRN